MKIHIYSIMRNEEFLLPYFLRHYSTFADKIFIIDDHSTDRTAEIAKANPKVELIPFPFERGLNEDDFSRCFEGSYRKYSQGIADWVMCVDGDEFVYTNNIYKNLDKHRHLGTGVLRCTAYTMVSEKLPSGNGQIYEESFMGARCRGFDKPIIFNPTIEIRFGDGRHKIKVPPGIEIKKSHFLLLHYRYLSESFFLERSKMDFSRMDMSNEIKDYRINRGRKWYADVLKNGLTKVI